MDSQLFQAAINRKEMQLDYFEPEIVEYGEKGNWKNVMENEKARKGKML